MLNPVRYAHGFALLGLLTGLVVAARGAAAEPNAPAAQSDPAANAGWEEMGTGSASGGGISHSITPSYIPAVALDAEGNPVIAWMEHVGGDWEIYVRRWNGQSWIAMGSSSASGSGISDDPGASESPVLALTPDGVVIVAWVNYYDDYNGSDIFVRRWDGVSWGEMGAGSAEGGGISQTAGHGSMWPAMTIDSAGMPIIAWSERINNTWEIYVRRWNGSTWREMGENSSSSGGISENAGYSITPSLAISPDGMPVVAWADNSGADHEIYIRRWNGADWVEMNSGSAYGGGISDDFAQSSDPTLAFFPNGNPIVAWVNYSGSEEEQWDIFARRWDGSSWEEMDGSASEGGISDNLGVSVEPSLILLPQGSPLIAWMDDTDGGYEIYALRWDGSAWVEAGINSASAGGISDGTGSSEYPALAVGRDGKAVIAWQYEDGNLSEIFVRKSPLLASFRFHLPTLFNSSCLSGLDEVEPNDTQLQANGPLCHGQTHHGLPNDNYDVFYFDTSTPGPITIELNNFSAGGGQLGLLSADFAPIVYDVTPGDGFHIIRANETAGRYYVIVHAATPNGTAGQYALRASFATR